MVLLPSLLPPISPHCCPHLTSLSPPISPHCHPPSPSQAFVPFLASWLYCPEAPGRPGLCLQPCRKFSPSAEETSQKDPDATPGVSVTAEEDSTSVLLDPCSEPAAHATSNGHPGGESTSLGEFCRLVGKLLRWVLCMGGC